MGYRGQGCGTSTRSITYLLSDCLTDLLFLNLAMESSAEKFLQFSSYPEEGLYVGDQKQRLSFLSIIQK